MAHLTPEHSPLGKHTDYIFEYDPSLLFPLPRKDKRDELGITGELPFYGRDIWNAWELSWLDLKGKPVMMIGRFTLPASAPNLIESKSFKLYLNSFNQSRYESAAVVQQVMEKDLSAAAGAPVSVELLDLTTAAKEGIAEVEGFCVDNLDVEVDCYTLNNSFLKHADSAEVVTETLYSHLLKSNCPVTGQPDWGTVVLSYTGKQLDREGVLKYICSFRQNQEFHEQCVERMYVDLMQICEPEKLMVEARYVRRGGLDINPVRSSETELPVFARLVRQ
ncbi:NADPH-dependent 7-cyano-7-deazaguanine reductase QueF [Endozoicomonadaceae bacterium StTr2]